MQDKKNYKQHKAYFQNIKPEERSVWLRQMLAVQQKNGEYPTFNQSYPSEDKWVFKGCEHQYYYSINPKQPSNAILFYFHGLNAHSGSSAYFTMNLAKTCSIDVYTFDFANFGRSSGENRGMISCSKQLTEQAEEFVQYIVGKQSSKKKIFISGLSLGGTICFKLAIQHPERYQGVIFLSPALSQNKQAAPYLKKVGKFVGWLMPNLKIMDQKFTDGTKFNQSDTIRSDPHSYTGKIVPGTIRVVLNFIQQVQQEWAKFKLPYIMIQSGVDKLVDPFQAIDFEKQCQSTDKSVVYFKDMWHAVFLQDELPEVIQVAGEWLAARANK